MMTTAVAEVAFSAKGCFEHMVFSSMLRFLCCQVTETILLLPKVNPLAHTDKCLHLVIGEVGVLNSFRRTTLDCLYM